MLKVSLVVEIQIVWNKSSSRGQYLDFCIINWNKLVFYLFAFHVEQVSI